jgi:hypothetical protein
MRPTTLPRYHSAAGVQTLESTISLLADEPLRVIDFAFGFTPRSDYEGFVAAPATGQKLPASADCQGLWNASSGTNTTCAFDANVLENLSYQSVWDAFIRLVRGMYVNLRTHQPSEPKDNPFTNTVLARSTELVPIVDLVRQTGNEFLQRDLFNRYSNMPGMYVTPGESSTQFRTYSKAFEHTQRPLSNILEDHFRNLGNSIGASVSATYRSGIVFARAC